jgi:hypothetical protein
MSAVFETSRVNYKWDSDHVELEYVASGAYNYTNNVITGVKYYKGTYFLTVPRWLPGVPSTLNSIQPGDTVLTPWPSWNMNAVGDCNAFQYVQSMEIDSMGRMWVIDVGSINLFSSSGPRINTCPPRLVIIDINSKNILKIHGEFHNPSILHQLTFY